MELLSCFVHFLNEYEGALMVSITFRSVYKELHADRETGC